MKTKDSWALPDGSYTSDPEELAKKWRELAAPMCRRTGWTVVGYDPDVLFRTTPLRGGPGATHSIPVDLLLKFNEIDRKARAWEDVVQKVNALEGR